jgi:Ca2+-binding RTX toxin-like protein
MGGSTRAGIGGTSLSLRGILAAAGTVAVAALVWAAIAIADEINCNGGGKQCNGTPFDDTITGSRKADGINAKGGHDDIYAKNGNDTVEGGDAIDYVEGGKGDDKISGGDDGDAFITGGLWGGPGDDTIEGGDGADDVHGEAGHDVLLGGPGDDLVDGVGDGNTKDRLSCGGGNFDTALADSKDRVSSDCEDVVPER